MTAHELARKLLEGPDLPVVHEHDDPVMYDEITAVAVNPQYFDRPVPWFPAGVGSNLTHDPCVELR